MSSGMNLEEAKEYAKTMSYRKAVNNIRYAKGIAYKKATWIKLRELAEIVDGLVRCGECKYCDKDSDRVTGQTVFICQRKNDENLWEKMNADDFCSYGEREDE